MKYILLLSLLAAPAFGQRARDLTVQPSVDVQALTINGGDPLNSYEEGTFTATYTTPNSVNITTGPSFPSTNTYTRIGNRVFGKIPSTGTMTITTAGDLFTNATFSTSGLPGLVNGTNLSGHGYCVDPSFPLTLVPLALVDQSPSTLEISLRMNVSVAGLVNGQSIACRDLYFTYEID